MAPPRVAVIFYSMYGHVLKRESALDERLRLQLVFSGQSGDRGYPAGRRSR